MIKSVISYNANEAISAEKTSNKKRLIVFRKFAIRPMYSPHIGYEIKLNHLKTLALKNASFSISRVKVSQIK